MSEIAIKCEGLSKQYRIGQLERYRALRDVVTDAAGAPFRRLRSAISNSNGNGNSQSAIRNSQSNYIWALDNLSFEVKQGEVVGVIGRNGAGKSTLLKILSRITKPTKGSAEIHGRVGSLLEVGTGFHPELTGRENIYLNGAILGMRKAEIDRKFDEIVAFAEVERFIDTPVKRYSSGMHVRLAFAVAAHLQPEILLIDEVLAVGDAAFQKKCLGKMGNVAREGRTVLFVSHNMQAMSQLADRCILLADGQTRFDGHTAQAVALYLGNETNAGATLGQYTAPKEKVGNHISWARVHTSGAPGIHHWGEPVSFEFGLRIVDPQESLCFAFNVRNSFHYNACYFWLFDSETKFGREPGTFILKCEVPKFRLYMGRYSLTAWLSERRGDTYFEIIRDICPFEVSMKNMPRDEYNWIPELSTYLEDGSWAPVRRVS
ncbi:MAG TPA: polysaccharide ABC transporter ATP-binding protein [Pyrinomonadaceae bacterium]|nr:polysaccharide ABC transporter ATP-binding protein [Pyrinomonadaceae bacterium]